MQQARAARLSVSALAVPRVGGPGEHSKLPRAPAIPTAAAASAAASASPSSSTTLPTPPSIDQWHELGASEEKDANYCGVEGNWKTMEGEEVKGESSIAGLNTNERRR